MARRTVVDEWRDVAAAAIRVCKIRRRRSSGTFGGCRSRTDARACGPADRMPPGQTGDGPGQLIGFSMVSIFLRSLVYNVLFYALLVFCLLIAIPTYLMPPRAFMAIAKAWSRSSVWLMRVICNTKVEYRGLEKIPKGRLIVASRR